jgi:hypothetical protein
MTEDAALTISNIRTLVGERQRYDEWLSALESRRAETPERVFQRVHGDYLARRDAVIANLHEHVGTLESLEQDLNSRLHNLETQLAEREDERAEAMLRTAVGEFDSDRWESTRHEVESSLAELGTQREALLAEADDTRALLTSARHKPAPVVAEAVAQPAADTAVQPVGGSLPQPTAHAVAETEHNPVVASADALQHAPSTPAATQSLHSTEEANIWDTFAAAAPEAPAHDEVETVAHEATATLVPAISVSELSDAQLDVDVDAAVNMLHEAPGATVPESLDNIDVFGESTVPPRAGSASDNGARASEGRPSWASEVPTNGAAKRDAFDDLAFLRSVTDSGTAGTSTPASSTGRGGAQADQTKTLRCTECGTMNFPTEWYCERCGGELAAF